MDLYEKLSENRKREVVEGKFPPWSTTGSYQMFKDKYEYQADGLKEQLQRIASTLAPYAVKFIPKHHEMYKSVVPNHGGSWEDAFFSIMWKNHLQPSTPVVANTGTDRGHSVSCSGGEVQDTIIDFYNTNTEAAILSKEGFGTSYYLGGVRPRGESISKGGIADGTDHPKKLLQNTARNVSQGGVRRGSVATYLPVTHPDFEEWAESLQRDPAGQNVGWVFPKSEIEALKESYDNPEDSIEYHRLAKTLRTRMNRGKGYFWKPDTVVEHMNEYTPWYTWYGWGNKSSNLCVAPETQILTKEGYIPISELEDCGVEVWNGEEWSEVYPKKTGENQKLLKVTTSAGQVLECTEYHKWYVFTGYGKPYREKRTYELQKGDKLIKFDLPVIEGTLELTHAYDNGFYSGDGSCIKGRPCIYLYHDKKELKDKFTSVSEWREHTLSSRLFGKASELKDKFFVPTSDYTIESRLKWLAGYLDADGCIHRNGTNESITACSVNYTFLQEIQLMLQTLGVSCKVCKFAEAGIKSLPANDGSGEGKSYYCQDGYRLLITSYDSFKLLSLGLETNRLKIKLRRPQRDAKKFNQIVSVVDEGRYDDTYCFTESKRHMGMFNGILTGNCTEITLHTDADHTFSCIISSMNAVNFDKYRDAGSVFVATVFLDALCNYFIAKAEGMEGLERVLRYTKKAKSLGLGLLGFHSYLQDNMIPMTSLEARIKNVEIFQHLQEESIKASEYIYDCGGGAEMMKEYAKAHPEWRPRAHSHLQAVAPNVSSAVLAGQVSQGIEPYLANIFMQPTSAGELRRINPLLLKLMKERGKYKQDVIKRIIENMGSVQKEDWLSPFEKEILLTAFEIPQEVLVQLNSERQPYVDQGVSLNLFFDSESDPEYIRAIHLMVLFDDNIKGAYYCRSESGVSASKDTDACVDCAS